MRPAHFDTRSIIRRLAIELGPIFLFFGTVRWQGIFVGTAAFMMATVLAALASWYRERRIPVLPLIGTAFALVMGGLTLVLNDPIWIVLRPTVLNLAAAVVLVIALSRGWLLLKSVFGDGLKLTDTAWRILTWRAIAFLVFLAIANEFVWRTYGIDTWVGFKALVLPILDLAFLAINWPLVSCGRRSQGIP